MDGWGRLRGPLRRWDSLDGWVRLRGPLRRWDSLDGWVRLRGPLRRWDSLDGWGRLKGSLQCMDSDGVGGESSGGGFAIHMQQDDTSIAHVSVIITPRAHARARGYVIGRGVYIYCILYIVWTFFWNQSFISKNTHFERSILTQIGFSLYLMASGTA